VKRNRIKSLLGLKNILENPSHIELRRMDLGVSGSLYFENMKFGGATNAQKDGISVVFSISVLFVMCLACSFVGFTSSLHLRGTN
jgi:hypothetical protein